MVRSKAVRVAVVLLVSAVAWTSRGATRVRTTASGRDVVTITPARPGRANVIVQFREAPSFAAGNGSKVTAQRFAAFDRDLARIDRDLRGRIAANGAGTNVDSIVTVRYERLFAGAAVTASNEAVARIRALDYVAAVHPDRDMEAFLEHSVPQIKAPEVWSSFGTRGKDIVVAIIDSGVDYDHPAFGGGIGAGHRVAGGWDFENNDADPMDDFGHGTHVAGIVGGNGGGVVGVAPEATLLAYKVLNDNGQGRESKIIAGLERAADPNQDGDPSDHADVANLSLGGPGTLSDPLTQAVDAASAAGIIVCVAAGNDGRFVAIGTPANSATAITVGASSAKDELADFSSKGPVLQNFAIKPDVVAPGVAINSAQAGGGIIAFDGTSMATPHVAGVAALLRAIHPQWPVAAIKSAITGTAEPLGNEAMAEGSGRVDALRAATADVVVTETSLSLGAASTAAHWTPSSALTFTNRGTVTRSLALESLSTQAGIGVTFDATNFDLAAGATRTVHVNFDIDNAQVPAPKFGSLAYSGAIRITGAAVPLRVPWAFVKGAAVTIDYDGPESYDAYFVSTTERFSRFASTDGGAQDAAVLLPLDTYDVVIVAAPSGFDSRSRLLVKENQALNGSVSIPMQRAAAAYEVKFDARDASGALLENSTRDCEAMVIVLAPQQSALGLISFRTGAGFFSSAMSERFAVAPIERCTTDDRLVAYAGQFPVVTGLAASQTLKITADEWRPTRFHARVPAQAYHPKGVMFIGWLWHDANEAAFDGTGSSKAVSGPAWDATLFLTPQRHPAISASGKGSLWCSASEGSTITRPCLDSERVYRVDEGLMLSHFRKPSASTYVALPLESILVGEGPAHAEPFIIVEPFMTATLLQFHLGWKGSLGEDFLSSTGLHYTVRDATGVIRTGEGIDGIALATDGPMEISATRPVSLRGIDGTSEMRVTFDSTATDPRPPALTSLMVLDHDGRHASAVPVGEHATLIFSALDVVPPTTYASIRAETMSVRWRAHGTTAWNALPASIVSSDVVNTRDEFVALGHAPTGTTFRADLSAATAAPAGIDLTFHFEDAAGNAYEWTTSPAFTVEELQHRRSVRH